ncbi:MAG: DUF4097 family beta strand repeat protein [Chitinophagaceae bacterium]|nr:DUF4097 family beta strand repeat protein [Chitinophagaceae bacterium]
MKKIILVFLSTALLFSCSEEKKAEETPSENGINISVNDDSTHADVNINANGIHVKTDDGQEADVNINANGIKVKTENGEEATIKVDGQNMDIHTKDGDANVKVDEKGNMKIKAPDGKEIEVNVKDGK